MTATLPQLAGHVQMLYFTDLVTGEQLFVTPSRGGIWIQDLDLGYPGVREVSDPYPDRHGTIDQTKYYGQRAVTLSVVCYDGIDATGYVQSASAWADAVAAWTVLGRQVKMTFQLWGQTPRCMYLRTSQLGAPIVGSGVDRYQRLVTMGWVSPDGFQYSVPASGVPIDAQRPDWYQVTASTFGGTTMTFNFNGTTGISFPVSFGGSGGLNAGVVSIPQNLVGSVATYPIITIRGGATQPKVEIGGVNGVRAKLEFSVNSGGFLTVAPNDVMVIDVAARTALLNPDGAGGYAANLYKYLAAPAQWKDFTITPQDTNVVTFYPVADNSATVAQVSWRQAFV